MGKLGIMIAKAVPPPGKIGPKPTEPDDDAPASDEDEDHAAELSAAEEFRTAVKSGSPDDVVSTFRNLSDICKGY